MHFENDEIAFEVPDDWCEKSRTMYVFPEAGAKICLTTRATDASLPIGSLADELVGQMMARWPGLELIERRDLRFGDEAGAHVEVESDGPGGRRRSVARMIVRDHQIWVLTAVTAVARLEETRASIDAAMRSLAPTGAASDVRPAVDGDRVAIHRD